MLVLKSLAERTNNWLKTKTFHFISQTEGNNRQGTGESGLKSKSSDFVNSINSNDNKTWCRADEVTAASQK